ncbi:hypothetical protein MTO96_044616, partial [Rhipicephalus appendiculatus]
MSTATSSGHNMATGANHLLTTALQGPVLGNEPKQPRKPPTSGTSELVPPSMKSGEFPPLEQQQHNQALEKGAPDDSLPESNMEDLEDTVSECSGSTSVSRPQTRTIASTFADHERRLTNIENQLQVIMEQLAQIPVMIQQ